MHLSFCPLARGKNGKALSAKAILGNQVRLSKWQSDFHAAMSARWPELERGISSMKTGRKHIPLSLFKQAERLDKAFAEIATLLDGITPFNAPKKKESLLAAFERVVPEAANFSVKVKQYDGYIKDLEQAEKGTQERIKIAENSMNERIKTLQNSTQKIVENKENELVEKDKKIAAAQREAHEAADKLRRQLNFIDHVVVRLPLEMRVRFFEERDKMAAINAAKSKNERGKTL
jgi:hypothetical protein